MKTFNYLFYMGLTIIFVPLFFILLMIVGPLTILEHEPEVVEQPHVTVYDTVEVKKVMKIYDTITVEKIKWIERVKPDTLN